MNDSLNSMSERLSDFRAARRWEVFHTPKNLAISVAIEAAELLEYFQWDEGPGNDDGRMAAEMADVAIYLLNLANVSGVDLADAIWSKIAENEKRFPVTT